MQDYYSYLGIMGIFVIFGVIEVLQGDWTWKNRRSRRDVWIEVLSLFGFTSLIGPLVALLTYLFMGLVFPGQKNALSFLSGPAMFAILLLVDDHTHYWHHRVCHRFDFFWKLHRTHHTSRQLGIGAVYRNGALYYLLMPNLYFSFALVYLGFLEVYVVYSVSKMLVVIAAHSEYRWDKRLYQVKFLRPLVWGLERLITTPATHQAHHGRDAADGISNPDGNFANYLFFWDVLYGSAKITRRYPDEYGLASEPASPWKTQLFYPLARRR